MEWVKIVSWHGVRTATRVPGSYVTLCGRRAHNDPVNVLPEGKSCETCLRIYAKREDV